MLEEPCGGSAACVECGGMARAHDRRTSAGDNDPTTRARVSEDTFEVKSWSTHTISLRRAFRQWISWNTLI